MRSRRLSVEGRVVGGAGEETVVGAHGAEDIAPELVRAERAEGGFDGRGDEPCAAFDFGFELACGPTGVADEGADFFALGLTVEGVFDGEVGGGGEFLGHAVPCEGDEGEVFLADGAAEVDRECGERGEFLGGEEIADLAA